MNDDDINVNTYDYDTIINDTVVSDTHSTSDPYVKRASVTTKMSRSDKLRSLAQQAHDNGDCVCCMGDTDLVFTRNEIIPSDTITIKISREDAEILIAGPRQEGQRFRDASNRELDAIRAALEGER